MLPNCLAFDSLPVNPASDLNQVQLFWPQVPPHATLSVSCDLKSCLLPPLSVCSSNKHAKKDSSTMNMFLHQLWLLAYTHTHTQRLCKTGANFNDNISQNTNSSIFIIKQVVRILFLTSTHLKLKCVCWQPVPYALNELLL